MMRRVERPVRLAHGRQKAVERSDDRDGQRRDDEVVTEAQRKRDALGPEQREQRVGQRQLAQERHARADVRVNGERDHRGDRGAGRKADELRRRRRPSPSHHHEHDDGDDADEHGPRVDAVVLGRRTSFRAATAAVRAQHLGNLVPDERDRETGHQSCHHRIRHEARDVAEAQRAEHDLDDARDDETQRGEEDHVLDDRVLLPQPQDECGEQEHGRGARHFVRKQRSAQHERGEAAEDRRGQRGAEAGLDGVSAGRCESDEPERQHHREQHESGGDAGAYLADEFGGVARRRDAMGVIGRFGHALRV